MHIIIIIIIIPGTDYTSILKAQIIQVLKIITITIHVFK